MVIFKHFKITKPIFQMKACTEAHYRNRTKKVKLMQWNNVLFDTWITAKYY